ncbi:MAG: hypothetical protein WA741_34990 [Candidatus Sulfotelmatobacter sp.]
MRKMMYSLIGMCFLAASLSAVAQSGDPMKQDQMKQDNMNHNMAKPVSVSGKVSADEKMFTSDKDNKLWTVSNPEVVKGHEGHHVTIKARIDAAKNQIDITSVKVAKSEMKDTMKKDEMQH